MTTNSLTHLPDRELLEAATRVAGDERRVTADLLALLGEIDARRLYLGEGCSSLFTYCTHVLRLSEHAAYHRIEAARTARQFPIVLDLLSEGGLTLTTVALLRPRLTVENHEDLLNAARQKSKRDVELQIANLAPQADVKPIVRRLTQSNLVQAQTESVGLTMLPSSEAKSTMAVARTESRPLPVVAPLAPDRYLLRITVSGETQSKLRRAQDLMRHTVPSGDPAEILERALTLLIEHLERTKIAKVPRPSSSPRRTGPPRHGRHIPASVRRAVWTRDDGRCAFVGPRERCAETGCLEFHHVIPFADGGPTDLGNLALRCRSHNQFESERWFGKWDGHAEEGSMVDV